MTTNYAHVPGVAGVLLRTADRCGLRITGDGGTEGWTITANADSASLAEQIYVYHSPGVTRSGRTNIYRAGRKRAVVKMTGRDAVMWIQCRRVPFSAPQWRKIV